VENLQLIHWRLTRTLGSIEIRLSKHNKAPMKPTAIAFLAAALLPLPFAAFAQAPSPRLEFELDVPDEVSLAHRPSGTGTNVRIAKVSRTRLKEGRMEAMIAPPVVEALGRCKVKPDTPPLRVRVVEGEMKDTIGESQTKLKGVGIYFNLPQTGVVDTGTWSASVFVALAAELRDPSGRVLAKREILAQDREVAPEGMPAGDFMASQAKGMDPRMEGLIRTNVAKAMPGLLEGVCL
jgi:hypothetical protein